MKRFFVVLLAVGMCLSLVACGDPTPKEITEETLKVVLVCTGDADEETSQAAAYAAQLQKAAEMVQVKDAQYAVCDGVSASNTALAEDAVRQYIKDGYSVVCGTSAGYAPAMKKLAAEYPRVTFVQVGAADETLPNYYAYELKTYEGAYFCGLVAGFYTENGNLGMIASDVDSVETHQMANAFLLGAQVKKPTATLTVTAGTTGEQYNTAVSNLSAAGCDGVLVTTDHKETVSFVKECGMRVYTVYGQADTETVTYKATVSHQNQLGDTLQAVLSKGTPYYNNMYVGYADGFLQCEAGFEEEVAGDALLVPSEAQKLLFKGEWDVFSGVTLAWDGVAFAFAETPAAVKDIEGTVRIPAGAGLPTAETLGGMDWWMQGITVL